MRWITAGESHGPALSAIIEGMPAHIEISTSDIDFHLARRRLGTGRGARQNFEADKVSILGGVRLGESQGGPISIQVGNSEWPKWEKVMSADPLPIEEIKDLARNAPLSRPRPGHADLVGMQKYDFDDARPILERANQDLAGGCKREFRRLHPRYLHPCEQIRFRQPLLKKILGMHIELDLHRYVTSRMEVGVEDLQRYELFRSK